MTDRAGAKANQVIGRLEGPPISVQDSASLIEIVEQRFRLFEIGRVETLGEPAVDRREKVASFGVATLAAAEPGEAYCGAQFLELRLLLLGDAQCLAIQFLGGR
jgi:hypothetical protein